MNMVLLNTFICIRCVHLAISFSLISSGRNSYDNKFYIVMKPIKKSTSAGGNAEELWSLQVFPYISYGEAIQIHSFEVTELTHVCDVLVVK